MLPVVVSLSLAAANAALLVASNTPSGAGSLTLAGGVSVSQTYPSAAGGGQKITTTVQTLDVARRVLVTYGSEASTRTIQIVGGDRFGNAISETLTIPATTPGSQATQQDFLTVTSINVFAAWSAAMTVGTNSTGSSQWFVVQNNVTPFNIGMQFVTSGTVTGQIDATLMNPNMPLPAGLIVPDLYQPTGLSSITTSAVGSISTPVVAYRLTITTGTGSIRMTTDQTGNVN